jgi:hypothetical protein
MERAAWTDERLDDLARRMDAGFERIDADIRELRLELRTEIGGLREEVHGEIGGLRAEMAAGMNGMRGEIAALRVTLLRVGGGMMAGLLGVIAAVLAGG